MTGLSLAPLAWVISSAWYVGGTTLSRLSLALFPSRAGNEFFLAGLARVISLAFVEFSLTG